MRAIAAKGRSYSLASFLPSSTPHWSNESMPQMTPSYVPRLLANLISQLKPACDEQHLAVIATNV